MELSRNSRGKQVVTIHTAAETTAKRVIKQTEFNAKPMSTAMILREPGKKIQQQRHSGIETSSNGEGEAQVTNTIHDKCLLEH